MSTARWTFAVMLVAGCSTLAPKPPEVECVSNEDCVQSRGPGFVCDVDVCRDGSESPPLSYIGLDLQEVAGGQAQFRAEIAGCDRELDDLDDSTIEVLSVPRREVAQQLNLAVYDEDSTNEQGPLLITSAHTIAQGSRFARDELRRQVRYAPEPDDEPEAFVAVSWPRYHEDDELPTFLGDGGYLVWQTQPLPTEEGQQARALRYQHLSPPVTEDDALPCSTDLDCCGDLDDCDEDDVRNACIVSLGACRKPFDDVVTYTYVYENDCDRELGGRAVSVDTQLNELGPMPAGASVTIRHADPNIAELATCLNVSPPQTCDALGLFRLDPEPLEDREPECDDDAACGEGLRCDTVTSQCELPLGGRVAWTGTVAADATPGLEGQVDARVYTYCDGLDNDADPLTRVFDVTVTPPESLGAPSVTLRSSVVFSPLQAGGQGGEASFGGDLCVPTLGELEDVALSLSGAPRELLPGYTCCDVDCLPRTADDAALGAPEPRSQCVGATSGSTATFRAETPLMIDPEVLDAWNSGESSCIPIVAESDGTVGVLRRSGACGSLDMDGVPLTQCDLRLPAGEDGELEYKLRIETPVGSVSGSLDTTLNVLADAGTTLSELALPDRILLQGRVQVSDCDPEAQTDGDCGSPGAQVLAERLRMAGESVDNVPGPYVHQVSTFFDPSKPSGEQAGAYVLPLDPGVWVVTALPDSGTDGGPARLELLDLRDAAARESHDFFLEPGILVTVDVSSFDRRSQIIPLDTGSWALPTQFQLIHPDRAGQPDEVLDLGAPGECLSTDPSLGCRIRRLIGGSSLPPTQLGQVRFTTRDLDLQAVDCQ
ncbi:MAG: hypothetical protein ACE37F_12050 [Nannocystaceae bacterium]|nr:hypothetical protein [bacterium]